MSALNDDFDRIAEESRRSREHILALQSQLADKDDEVRQARRQVRDQQSRIESLERDKMLLRRELDQYRGVASPATVLPGSNR